MLKVIFCLAAAFFASSLPAALLFQDNFSYSDGPIVTAPGSPWSLHSGSAGDALVAGGKLEVSSSRGDDVDASIPGQPYTAASGSVLYSSFKVSFSALPTSGGAYFAHFNASSFRGVIFASTSGAPSAFFRLGIGNTSGATATSGQLTNNLSLNQTYFIVTRYNVATGLGTIWLNPALESDPNVTAADSASTVNILAYSFRQTPSEGTMVIDDLKLATSFADVVSANSAITPTIQTQPQSQTVFEGANVSFEVVSDGTQPLFYQWKFNGTNLVNANGSTLSLTNVSMADAGDYTVMVSNSAGSTNSVSGFLTVNPAPTVGVSLLTYNVKGNGTTNWSTNTAQVMAIGREVMYLNPDIITFNEIPYTNTYQMTNFVKAFLPGYFLATNSGTDNFIRSVIASRYPITRSQSWLDGADLKPFGYTNTSSTVADNFTRDLFEAEINVPGFSQHFHVFTTHLKSSSTNYVENAAKRAAEAAAITNFFATNFFVLYPSRPYVLTGDMNDSDTNTLALQRLLSAPMGTHLTNPKNPFTGSINTFSSTSPSSRIDYIFPTGLLFSNIISSQVFRSDRLTPLPPNLLTNDSQIASDHLAVMMVFANPYTQPFKLLSIARTNSAVTLHWESVIGGTYRVETSSNLLAWSNLASNLTATGGVSTLTTNLSAPNLFFRVRAP
ncbi:MAG: immunoglobulin domain-containing protein [Verrucomicrobiota bacterium]